MSDQGDPLRKRLHQLMSQNYRLSTNLQQTTLQLTNALKDKHDLQQQLKIVMQQLRRNDNIQQAHQRQEQQLQLRVEDSENKLRNAQETIQQLNQLNFSLEMQNKMLFEIKQKYLAQCGKLRGQINQYIIQKQGLFQDNQQLAQQIKELLSTVAQLQEHVEAGRSQLKQYQQFVLSRIEQTQPLEPQDVKNDKVNGQIKQDEVGRLHRHYIKYKRRAGRYRVERDQLLKELTRISCQMDSSSLQKYFSDRSGET